MAGWMERMPTLTERDAYVIEVADKMQAVLDRGEDLEGETFTVEVDWKIDAGDVKRAIEEGLYRSGVQVEVDVYPVREQNRWDLMCVVVGTMAPNLRDVVR